MEKEKVFKENLKKMEAFEKSLANHYRVLTSSSTATLQKSKQYLNLLVRKKMADYFPSLFTLLNCAESYR